VHGLLVAPLVPDGDVLAAPDPGGRLAVKTRLAETRPWLASAKETPDVVAVQPEQTMQDVMGIVPLPGSQIADLPA
jgi:hypothetical protein